jgi:antitoxin component YwqK of YwqJK toxin-antitoxin module
VKVKGYTTYTARGELVNGKQNGLWMAFFDDLRSDWAEIINYKDGKKHGEHKIWWEREVSKYSPGEDFPTIAPWNTVRAEIKNYKEGILHGKYIEHPVYYGNYYKEGSYSEGKEHGEWIMKFPDSEQLANRKTYNKGQLVKEEYWDENGESIAPPN